MLLLTGCVSSKPKPRRAAENLSPAPVEQLNLLAVPVALHLGQGPGPDGFAVKVYASNQARPKPIAINDGALEIMMYDGLSRTEESGAQQPRKIWKYTAEELKRFSTRTSIGIGYELAPRWGEAKPLTNKISVVARYTPPSGPAIYTAPSVIAVTSH